MWWHPEKWVKALVLSYSLIHIVNTIDYSFLGIAAYNMSYQHKVEISRCLWLLGLSLISVTFEICLLAFTQLIANYQHFWIKVTQPISKLQSCTSESGWVRYCRKQLQQFLQITAIKYSSLISIPFKMHQWNVWRQQLDQLNYSKHTNCIVANRRFEQDYAHTFPLFSAFPTFSHDQLHFLTPRMVHVCKSFN